MTRLEKIHTSPNLAVNVFSQNLKKVNPRLMVAKNRHLVLNPVTLQAIQVFSNWSGKILLKIAKILPKM